MSSNYFRNQSIRFITCFLSFVSVVSFGQHKSITNIAGNGSEGYVGGADPIDALLTGFEVPGAIAPSPDGGFYFSETSTVGGNIYKYDIVTKMVSIYKEVTAGVITSIACDNEGNVYYNLFDLTGGVENFYIHKIELDGTDSYYIGDGTNTWTPGDALASDMTVVNPRGLYIDNASKYLYYTEDAFGVIRRVDLATDYVELYLGDGGVSPPNIEIPNATPRLDVDADIATGKAVGADGTFYFWTKLNQIYKVNPDDNAVYLVAGNGEAGATGDGGLAIEAQLASNGLGALLMLNEAQLLIADFDNNKIRSVDLSTGIISTFAGTGAFYGDGLGENDLLSGKYLEVGSTNLRALDMKLDQNGDILFSDPKAFYICKIVNCTNPVISDITIDKSSFCKGDEIVLTINGELNDAGIWEWYKACPDEVPITEGINYTTVIDIATSYYVRGVGGCSNAADCFQKDIELTCKDYYNTFTPNNDGFNDYFEIPILDSYPVNKVSFYDRWGHLLEEFDNYNNTDVIWGGTNGADDGVGDVLESGTYFFVAVDEGGVEITSGWIQLITK